MNNKKKLMHVLGCLVACGVILSLRQIFIYPQGISWVSKAIIDDANGFIVAFMLMDFASAVKNIPWAALKFFFSIVFFLLGYLMLNWKPSIMKMGSAIFSADLTKVIKLGLISYFMRVILIFVFIYSVVGIPIAIGIIVVTNIVDIVGVVPVAVNIGANVQEMINGNDRRMEYNYIIGAVAMLISANVYAVGCALFLFIFPVLSFGTVSCMVEKKVFCIPVDTSEFENEKKDKFDRKKIRDIITKGLD